MTKLKASFIHLLLSVLAITTLFSIIYFIWYPKPFFDISGTIEPLKLLILIDVVVGPLLTFIVYKKGKKTLVFDLSVIAIIQVAALIYGAYTIHEGRPTLLVMHNGKFNYLVDKYSDYKDLDDSLKPHIFSKPKYAFNSNSSVLDLYQDNINNLPINDPENQIYLYAQSHEQILERFPKRSEQIEQLKNKYSGEDLEFYVMNNDGVVHYVVYSREKKQIIDRLEF